MWGPAWRLCRGGGGGWRPRRRHASSIVLSERRLQEFMHAEINYFASMCAQPVKLAQIFKASTPALAANLIYRQLPVHFATRIKQIEALPHWDAIPELREVHKTLSDSFRNLRLLEQGSDLEPLTRVIRDLRQRHKSIVSLLGIAMAHLRAECVVDEAFANQWLDSFLLARISTEMLTLHYTLMSSGQDGSSGSCRGIVDSRCDPSEICRQAVDSVRKDPRYQQVPMKVESFVCGSSEKGLEFSFLPQYLLLLVEELLKNSAFATVRNTPGAAHAHYPAASSSSSSSAAPASSGRSVPPVQVFVGADDRQVMIEISDKGGGIPAQSSDRIWSYSSGSSSNSVGGLGGHSAEERIGLSWADPLSGLGIKQRLGMGLPLTRLYTQYLGGSLELMSIPGVGVDTFLQLRRIDVASLEDAE